MRRLTDASILNIGSAIVLALLLAGILCLSRADAFWQSRDSNYNVNIVAAGGGYTGPGNINTTNAIAWWGLRAYTSALANAGATTTPVMDVRGVTTTTSCTIYLLGNGTGGLDFTTAGAGGIGNQCLLGATTFCTSTNASCTVSKLYDQTVGSLCTGSCNLLQATSTLQPTLTFNCIGSLPCLTFTATSFFMETNGYLGTAYAQPFSVSAIIERTSNFTTYSEAMTNADHPAIGWANVASQAWLNGGAAAITVSTIADSAFHVMNGLYNGTGTSSILYIDGTSHTGSTGTGPMQAAQFCIGGNCSGGFIGNWTEGGWWHGDESANFATINSNQHTYWGF